MKEHLEKVQSPAREFQTDKEFPRSPHTPMHTAHDIYTKGNIIPISPTDDVLKVYAFNSPGYTRLATANNRNSSLTKYDVAVWIRLRDGSVPGLLVVATILNGEQYAQIDLTSRKWKIISFQFFGCYANELRKKARSTLWTTQPHNIMPRLERFGIQEAA